MRNLTPKLSGRAMRPTRRGGRRIFRAPAESGYFIDHGPLQRELAD